MLDNIPEDLQCKILNDFGSPKSRQAWAQVSHEAHRLARQSDATYYKQWLRDDFCHDAPVGAEPIVKAIYRECVGVSQQEKARLMCLAQTDDVRRFSAGIADVDVQKRLSSRYGKRPLADAGLAMTRRLAQPRSHDESPPRLCEGDLAALEQATSVLHALDHDESAKAAFCHDLRHAARQAEQQVTRAIEVNPANDPPPAPKRRRTSRL